MREKYTREEIGRYVHRFLLENDLTYRDLGAAIAEFYPGGVSHSAVMLWVKKIDSLPSERILNVIYQEAPTRHKLFRFADDLLTMIASVVWHERFEEHGNRNKKLEKLSEAERSLSDSMRESLRLPE